MDLMMKAFFSDMIRGKKAKGIPFEDCMTLPFDKLTARAIIIRKHDGAILGTLHRPDGKFAPPGGFVDKGECASDTIQRELAEENIKLINAVNNWEQHLAVSYFSGYRSLDLWYVIIVEDAAYGPNDETVESRWFDQKEDVWYPLMRERILLAIKEYVPELLQVEMKFLG